MYLWKDLRISEEYGPNVPKIINAVVKIPAKSRNKYDLQPDTGLVLLETTLPKTAPCEYAFVPQTMWDDGKPLKVFVLTQRPTLPGCLIEVRPVALLKTHIDNASSNKILAVPVHDKKYGRIKDLEDVTKKQLRAVENFLKMLCKTQDKRFSTTGWEGADRAQDAVEHAVDLFDRRE